MIREGRRFFEEHRRWVLGVVTVLLLNALLRVAVVAPLRKAVDSLDEGLTAGQIDLAEAVAEWDKSSRHAALLERADQNVAALYANQLKTHRERYTQVDQDIKDLAKEFRLEPTSIQYNFKKLDNQGLERFVASFPLKGKYENVRNFISHIEASEQLFIIEKVSLTDPTERGAELNLQISVTTYFWMPEEEPPGAARGGSDA